MRRLLCGAACLVALAPGGWAVAADEDADDPAAQAAQLKEEWTKGYAEIVAAYQAATADEDRQKQIEKYQALLESTSTKFTELAQAHPKTQAACTALVWLLMYGRSEKPEETLDTLIKDHAQHEGFGVICHLVARFPDRAEEVIELALKSPHRADQGHATYCRAARKQEQIDRAGSSDEAAALSQEAEALLDKVVQEYADVPGLQPDTTLGKMAEGELFVLRNLSVGKVAPEITGEDIDGVKFSLSDYRGRVVMLDFWGSW